MKINFRKIASTASSVLMIGSTVAMAAAANYPAPYVSGGVANVGIVYGSNAASSDLVAAAEVTSSLQTALSDQASSGDTTVTGGDFVRIEKSATKFHLGDGILDVVSGTLTDSDLGSLLADGSYLDANNDLKDYTQKILLANLSMTEFESSDYKPDVPTIGFSVSSGTHILNYTLDFSDNPDWSALADSDIEILGNDYYISSITTNTTIDLLDTTSTTSLSEGETTSLDVGSKTYDVSIDFIGTTSVKLNIDGELTNSLSTGDTYRLKDGSYVAIKDILTQDYQGGIKKVEFSIGSGKIRLRDGDEVKINDNVVNGLTTYFTTNSAEQLQKIVLQWDADDDSFITEDSKITLPGFENLELRFDGMTYPGSENFTVEQGGSTYVDLSSFPVKIGNFDLDILYGNTTGTQFLGVGRESGRGLQVPSGGNDTSFTNIVYDASSNSDRYFVATFDDGSNAESYVMRATSFSTNSGGTADQVDIEYRSDDSWKAVQSSVEQNDTVSLGSVSLTINSVSKAAKTVNITGGSNVNFNTLYTPEGLKVQLPYEYISTNYTADGSGLIGALETNTSADGYLAPTTYNLQFLEEDKNDNPGGGSSFNMTLGWASSKPTVSSISGDSGSEEVDNTNVYESYMYSALATKFLYDTGGDQDTVDVTYHGGESYGSLLVAEAGSTTSSGSSELGSVMVMDTEVSSVSTKNLIVVGGSCINTVAASLLNSDSALCGSDFTGKTGVGSGSFLIETFTSPFSTSKVATLVAGYEASDTTNAVTFLKTQDVSTAVGDKYVGTTATSATLV